LSGQSHSNLTQRYSEEVVDVRSSIEELFEYIKFMIEMNWISVSHDRGF